MATTNQKDSPYLKIKTCSPLMRVETGVPKEKNPEAQRGEPTINPNYTLNRKGFLSSNIEFLLIIQLK